MAFIDLVKKSRSYRGYDQSRPVTEEELISFVNCARYAPSSVNGQPFQYYVASERDEVAKILSLTTWAKALPDLKLPHPGMGPTGFIVILQNKDWDERLDRYVRDVGIAAQTMLLAASDAGLGGCMIGNFSPRKISQALSLPDNLVPMLLVAFGKPAETVVLTEAEAGESLRYYRDENDVHYVPKRKLKDIVIRGDHHEE